MTRSHRLLILLSCIAMLALPGAVGAEVAQPDGAVVQQRAEPASGSCNVAASREPASVGPLAELTPAILPLTTCTISVDCTCVDETISCSGPTGSCYSGGSGCDEWVQCGTNPKTYCPPAPPPCQGSIPCVKNSDCTTFCGGFGFCTGGGCCAC